MQRRVVAQRAPDLRSVASCASARGMLALRRRSAPRRRRRAARSMPGALGLQRSDASPARRQGRRASVGDARSRAPASVAGSGATSVCSSPSSRSRALRQRLQRALDVSDARPARAAGGSPPARSCAARLVQLLLRRAERLLGLRQPRVLAPRARLARPRDALLRRCPRARPTCAAPASAASAARARAELRAPLGVLALEALARLLDVAHLRLEARHLGVGRVERALRCCSGRRRRSARRARSRRALDARAASAFSASSSLADLRDLRACRSRSASASRRRVNQSRFWLSAARPAAPCSAPRPRPAPRGARAACRARRGCRRRATGSRACPRGGARSRGGAPGTWRRPRPPRGTRAAPRASR